MNSECEVNLINVFLEQFEQAVEVVFLVGQNAVFVAAENKIEFIH
jgi:hypothetical protein